MTVGRSLKGVGIGAGYFAPFQHLTVDTDARMRLKPLGEPGRDVEYQRDMRGFAGDCVYRLQRHFVDCMLSGAPFESTGQDYLKTIEVVEAAYESAARSTVVRVDPARRRVP